MSYTPQKISGWDPRITQLKRKIIWTKPSFSRSVSIFHNLPGCTCLWLLSRFSNDDTFRTACRNSKAGCADQRWGSANEMPIFCSANLSLGFLSMTFAFRHLLKNISFYRSKNYLSAYVSIMNKYAIQWLCLCSLLSAHVPLPFAPARRDA